MSFNAPEKPLIVFGASGHGACVVAAAQACGLSVWHLIDDAPGEPVLGVPVAAPRVFNWPDAFDFIIAIGDCAARKAKFNDMLKRGGTPAAPIIHPRAYVTPGAQISRGSVIFAHSTIDPRVTIGDNVIVNIGAAVAHDCLIESHSHIAPNAAICGHARIGEGAWIGAGTVVVQGKRVGDWAFVGAGSVVARDIPARMLAKGHPAHRDMRPIDSPAAAAETPRA